MSGHIQSDSKQHFAGTISYIHISSACGETVGGGADAGRQRETERAEIHRDRE